MKTFHNRSLHWINYLLGCLLGLLGFSCDSEDISDLPAEYGTPWATYQFKGRVLDQSKKPVENARVRIILEDDSFQWLYEGQNADTTHTDGNGEFFIETQSIPYPRFLLITEDMDGETNSRFLNDTTRVVFEDSDYQKDDKKWHIGTAIRDVEIQLRPWVETHTAPYALYTIYGTVTNEDGMPLPGILILTDPDYGTTVANNVSAAAITNQKGYYQFTYDQAPAETHKIFTNLYKEYWNGPSNYESDTTEVDFSTIELSNGKGLLIGQGSQEINFQLKQIN